MPASEETYRSQRRLHIVFGVSSVALVATTAWMILDDHMRPWKQVQREFQQVERAKLVAQRSKADEATRQQNQSALEEVEARIAEARGRIEANAGAISEQEAKIASIQGEYSEIDTRRKFQKAELDSQRSLYDGMIERDETREARVYRDTIIVE